MRSVRDSYPAFIHFWHTVLVLLRSWYRSELILMRYKRCGIPEQLVDLQWQKHTKLELGYNVNSFSSLECWGPARQALCGLAGRGGRVWPGVRIHRSPLGAVIALTHGSPIPRNPDLSRLPRRARDGRKGARACMLLLRAKFEYENLILMPKMIAGYFHS